MTSDFHNAIRRTRRALLLRRVVRGSALGVVAAIPLAWFTVAALPAGMLIGAWFGGARRPTPTDAAIWLDRRLQTRDLLATALHAQGMAKAFLEREASSKLRLVPTPPWPMRAMGLAVSAVLLVAAITLLRTPPPRTVAMTEEGTADAIPTPADPRSTPPDSPTGAEPGTTTPDEPRDAVAMHNGPANAPGNVSSVGGESADTDTLRISTPDRNESPTNGNDIPGTGGTARGDGETDADGQLPHAPLTDGTPSAADSVIGNDSASSLPPQMRALIDAYYR